MIALAGAWGERLLRGKVPGMEEVEPLLSNNHFL